MLKTPTQSKRHRLYREVESSARLGRGVKVFAINDPTPGDVNGPPQMTRSISGSLAVGTPLDFTFEAFDPDGDTVTFSSADLPAGAAVDAGGRLTWTPTLNQIGSHSFDVSVSDGQVSSSAMTITLQVIAAGTNAPPQINSQPVTRVAVGTAYRYDVNAFDPDPTDTLSYSLSVSPAEAEFSIDSATGLISASTDAIAIGDYVLTVTVTDNGTTALNKIRVSGTD